jgi:hypothetical protein
MPDVTYTMLRTGVKARQVTAGDVTFDVGSDGKILGAHCVNGADWVSEIIKFLMAGRLRVDVEE